MIGDNKGFSNANDTTISGMLSTIEKSLKIPDPDGCHLPENQSVPVIERYERETRFGVDLY